jgi:type I restriction enzyme M protein
MAVDAAKELSGGESPLQLPDLYELPEALDMPFALQSGVVQLLVGLLEPTAGQRLYAPWDQTGQLAANLAKRGHRVLLEHPESTVPSLMALAYSDLIHVVRKNPITGRGLDGGYDADFDGAVSFLPIGMRIDQKQLDYIVSPELLKERTSSAAVLGIRQLLGCTRGRVVVAVQNNVLFSSGAEYNLRRELLLRGRLKAVIAMPAGLLDRTGLSFAILVLERGGESQTVRFVNADSARFKSSVGRTRSEMCNIEELLSLALGQADDSEAADVSVQDILANDAQLQVSRYVIPQEAQQMRRMLASARTVALEDIAAFVRPVPLTTDKDQLAEAADDWLDITHAVEVVSADLPDFGFVQHPRKEVYIDTTKVNLEATFLRPHDIVLMIKGSTGKVGIAPEMLSTVEPMVAGQSSIVLRVFAGSPIDPRALFVQLRSKLGQALLRSIVSGASLPLIHLKELKRLQVIVPSLDEQTEAIQALEKEARLQEQIDALHERQARVSSTLWQLS